MAEKKKMKTKSRVGLFLGPLVVLLFHFIPIPEGLSRLGMDAFGLTFFIVIWWLTDAVPRWVVGFTPIIWCPLLGISGTAEHETGISAYSQFADTGIWLAIGMFVFAAAMTKWNLHKRIALTLVVKVAKKPTTLLLALMISIEIVSAFMANTTAVAMMMPLAVSFAAQVDPTMKSDFSKACLLAAPFGATIGGMITITGSGTNNGCVRQVLQYTGVEITYMDWVSFGLPFAIILTVALFFIIKFIFKVKNDFDIDRSELIAQYNELGPMTKGEKGVIAIFVVGILMYVFSANIKEVIPLWNDNFTGVLMGLATFLVPVDWKHGEFLMDAKYAIREVQWNMILSMASALFIGNALFKSGAANWLADKLSFVNGMSEVAIVIIFSLFASVLTEFTQNNSMRSMLMPICYAVATAANINPVLLMVSTGLACSFGFALPSAAPTLQIALGASEELTEHDLLRLGIPTKIACAILFPLVLYFVAAPLTSVF